MHAGVAAKADERDKLERLCRYITRPAMPEKRLSLTEHGQVRYTLKNPWRDGSTHVIFEPLDFIAASLPSCPNPASISHDFMVCSHPTANSGPLSRPPDVARNENPKLRTNP